MLTSARAPRFWARNAAARTDKASGNGRRWALERPTRHRRPLPVCPVSGPPRTVAMARVIAGARRWLRPSRPWGWSGEGIAGWRPELARPTAPRADSSRRTHAPISSLPGAQRPGPGEFAPEKTSIDERGGVTALSAASRCSSHDSEVPIAPQHRPDAPLAFFVMATIWFCRWGGAGAECWRG